MSDIPTPDTPNRLEQLIKAIVSNRDLNDTSPRSDKLKFQSLVIELAAELEKPDLVVPVELFALMDNSDRHAMVQMFTGIMAAVVQESLAKPSRAVRPGQDR